MMLRKTLIIVLCITSSIAKAELLDPTRPLTFNEGVEMHCSQGNLLLQSISYGQNKQIALISGSFYTLGDKVNLYTITAMTPDSVTLKRESETTVLTL